MHRCPLQRMVQMRADVPDRLAPRPAALVEETRDPEVATRAGNGRLGHCAVRPWDAGHDLGVVFECRQDAVANRSGLPGDLRGAEQLGWLRQAVAVHLHVLVVGEDRGAADAARVEHGGRGALEGRPRAPGAAAAGHDVAAAAYVARCRGTPGGGEDLAAFEEEEPLLREVGLASGEVDDYVVGLHRAEIGQQRRRDLEVGRRSPEDVGARLVARVAVAEVPRRGRVREHGELLARRDLGHAERLQRRHEACARRRQRRPAPALVDIRHLARRVVPHLPITGGLRHGHHRPRQEHLRAPAAVHCRRGAFPRAVPFAREVALRGDLAVHHRAAKVDAEPVAVEAFAGGVENQAPAVAIDGVVARRKPRDQRLRRLLVPRTRIEPLRRVEELDHGTETRLRERIRLHHDHLFVARHFGPDRLVEAAVDLDVDILETRRIDHFTGRREPQPRDRHGGQRFRVGRPRFRRGFEHVGRGPYGRGNHRCRARRYGRISPVPGPFDAELPGAADKRPRRGFVVHIRDHPIHAAGSLRHDDDPRVEACPGLEFAPMPFGIRSTREAAEHGRGAPALPCGNQRDPNGERRRPTQRSPHVPSSLAAEVLATRPSRSGRLRRPPANRTVRSSV